MTWPITLDAGSTLSSQRRRTRDLAIAEAIKPLAEMGDLTSAAIRYQMMTEERQISYRPATLGRRPR